ncbi:MAG: haloacid dehalogenase-like hydrolase [Burkholderiales bacterium]|nr:haloacid dehalogenase-like hydrolase [Burkholderiales bacterium]
MSKRLILLALLVAAWVVPPAARAQAADPLPSWNDGPAKARILAFVRSVTEPGGKDFVPPAERIAVFDNDGTLWSEQPIYFQLAFAIDRAKALVAKNPALAKQPALKAAAAGDLKALAARGERGLAELVAATHANVTSDEFARIVREWVATAQHPTLKRPYTSLTFQPMRELLDYLRANGFKTYIVSGGGIEFLRVLSEELYGVPPEQVIGSSIETKYEVRKGVPVIVRLPQIDFIDDKAGKPVAIHKFIGRRPIAAFGNSDGDFEMLEWTTAAPGPRLGAIVRHDDAAREFAYDRASPVGTLSRALDEAPRRGWTVISIRDDWRTVFPAAR